MIWFDIQTVFISNDSENIHRRAYTKGLHLGMMEVLTIAIAHTKKCLALHEKRKRPSNIL